MLLIIVLVNMSQSIAGVFLESDNPTIEFVKWLDEKQPANGKFVIAFLSNTSLFIKNSREEYVREEVTKWQRSNKYEDMTKEILRMTQQDATHQDLVAILEGLLRTAANRASTYGELDAAFKEMCRFKYDKVYTDVFPQLTKTFNEISSTVQSFEKQLVALGQTEMAATVRTIQEHERSKLQTTLQLHALRKDYSFRALPFQHSSPDDWSVVEEDKEDGAAAHSHDHLDSSVPDCCCHVKPPPSVSQFQGTREEFQAACDHATATLEHLINEINQQLADISCELADLREEAEA